MNLLDFIDRIRPTETVTQSRTARTKRTNSTKVTECPALEDHPGELVDPLDLLTSCYRAGVRVIPEEDRLRLHGLPCPADLNAKLEVNKPGVLTTLTTQGVGAPSRVPEVEAIVAYVVPCTNSICPVVGPCPSVLDGQPCPLVAALEI